MRRAYPSLRLALGAVLGLLLAAATPANASIGGLQATLHDPGASAGDCFGVSAAKSGSTAIVGASGCGPATSVPGAAYIYLKGKSGWPTTPSVTLNDPENALDDHFGFSVAIAGNTAVVGAYHGLGAGKAYIYESDGSGWPSTPTVTLTVPNIGSGDRFFGASVATSGATVVIGADATNESRGAAYIYQKGSAGWPSTPSVTLNDPASPAGEDIFGYATAVSGNAALVTGAFTDGERGAGYIYLKGKSGWPSTPSVTLGDPGATSGDKFGYPQVSASGTAICVGASGTNSSRGTAYIYVKGKSGWPSTPSVTLSDPGATAGDSFGAGAVVSGNTALVGAPGTDKNRGTAYIYVKGKSGWPSTPSATVNDPAATEGDDFPSSPAIGVSAGSAIAGDQRAFSTAGAAYIFSS